MSVPSYKEMLRHELENNKELTAAQRLSILKILGRFEIKKLNIQELRHKRNLPPKVTKGRDDLKPGQFPEDAPPAVPLGQKVESILSEIKRDGQVLEEGDQASGTSEERREEGGNINPRGSGEDVPLE